MKTQSFLALLLTLTLVSLTLAEDNKWVSRGLPDVEWTSWEDAKQGSTQNSKPIMVLFTKSWCEESTALKEGLRNSPKFLEVAKNFNLVNVEETEEVMQEIGFFCTDGDYTPRMYFAHPDGTVEDRIHSPGRTEMRFLYLEAPTLVSKMEEINKNGLPSLEKDEL